MTDDPATRPFVSLVNSHYSVLAGACAAGLLPETGETQLTVREALAALVFPEWFLELHVIVAAIVVIAGIFVIITANWILSTVLDYLIWPASAINRPRCEQAILGNFILDTGLFLLLSEGTDVMELLDEHTKRDVRFLERQGFIAILGGRVFLTPEGFELLQVFQEEGTRDERLIEETKDALRLVIKCHGIDLKHGRTDKNLDRLDKTSHLLGNIIPEHLQRILCSPELAVAMQVSGLTRIELKAEEWKAARGYAVGITVVPVTAAGLGAAGGFAATAGADTLVAATGIGGGATTGYFLGKLAGKGRLRLRVRRSRQARITELLREEIAAELRKQRRAERA